MHLKCVFMPWSYWLCLPWWWIGTVKVNIVLEKKKIFFAFLINSSGTSAGYSTEVKLWVLFTVCSISDSFSSFRTLLSKMEPGGSLPIGLQYSAVLGKIYKWNWKVTQVKIKLSKLLILWTQANDFIKLHLADVCCYYL